MALSVNMVVAQDELPRDETLYVAGFQFGPPTSYNPLAYNGATWPALNTHKQLYETLFVFNSVAGTLDPLLASDLTWSDDGISGVITLQEGTQWQDGEPLTAADVVFSFELAQTNEDLYYSTFWDYVSEMTAGDDQTIEFTLNPDQVNPGIVNDFFARVDIVPEHIWAERTDGDTPVLQYDEQAPVGSGPYTVMDTSTERVVIERFDGYWGAEIYGLPAPRYVVHPIFSSNDAGNLALQRGEVDLSQQFAPQIWQMWEEDGLPVGTWFAEEPYHVPGNIPFLNINIHKPGLDNVAVRRALAYAINYPQIAAVAMSRYSAPAQPSIVLPSGGEAQFFNAEQAAELGWEYNPDRAREILEQEAGATMGADGIYVLPDGTRLGPYTLLSTFGWTDWNAAADLAAQSATEAGIEVFTEYPEYPLLLSSRNNGDFDLVVFSHSGASPAQPWQRFHDVLDDRGVADFGEQAFWNWGRFSHPDVAALLDEAAATSDVDRLQELYTELDRIYQENIPAIPLMYRPLEFYEFNESVWCGFPTADNAVGLPLPERAALSIYNVISVCE
ncbi:MAG: ABC transporter substrate-binding protein [Burkholderiales bacterium]|nr:ABC transporter substrate-binding protein [Anaerolineae bacterium]